MHTFCAVPMMLLEVFLHGFEPIYLKITVNGGLSRKEGFRSMTRWCTEPVSDGNDMYMQIQVLGLDK